MIHEDVNRLRTFQCVCGAFSAQENGDKSLDLHQKVVKKTGSCDPPQGRQVSVGAESHRFLCVRSEIWLLIVIFMCEAQKTFRTDGL